MAEEPNYQLPHFNNYASASQFQQQLLDYINSLSSSDVQDQIDDINVEIGDINTNIDTINDSLFDISTGEYWNNSVVSTNATWSFGTIIGDGAIPNGGTLGQTILKGSATDYDYDWGDLTASNGVDRVLNDFSHSDTSSISNQTFTGAEVVSAATYDTFGHAQTLTKRTLTVGDIGAEPQDDTLTTIAATDPTTDQINYFTATNVASVTSLTAFARTLIDDTTQGAMQTTLDVDPAGTDNSTNVTLDGTPNYITIVGQLITRALINLTSHVTGILPLLNGGTGSSTASGARTNLNVDVAGTDNSTDVTLVGTPNYITIVGQVITRALVNLTSHVTGVLPLANGGTNDAAVTSANIGHLKSTNQDLATTDDVNFVGGEFSGDITLKSGATPKHIIFDGDGFSARDWAIGFDTYGSTSSFVIRDLLQGITGFKLDSAVTITAGGDIRLKAGSTPKHLIFDGDQLSSRDWLLGFDTFGATSSFVIRDVLAGTSIITLDSSARTTLSGVLRVQGTAAIISGGTGSPEGVVTAVIGSRWGRTDGGAGTSQYKKESGTGNTGWVAY